MRKDGTIEGYKTGGGGKQQPFGENGRYGAKSEPGTTAEKDSFGSYRQNTDYQTILDSDDPGRDAGELGLNRNLVKAVGFARRDTISHQKHAKALGLNQREYEREAIKFYNSNKGSLYHNSSKGKFYRYNEGTREFVSCNENGEILSYYIARKGWFDQKLKGEKGIERI